MNKKMVLSVPSDVYVTLTSKCNLQCLHCYGNYGNATEREMSYSQWCVIFRDLANAGVFFINLSGGEPTTHPKFVKIVRFLKKINLHFILTTNGVFSTLIRNELLSAKDVIAGIKFSLDGPDPQSHTALRRVNTQKISPNVFNTTVENIRFFSKNKIPITIATCLHSKNIHLINKLALLIEDLHPVSWFVSTIAPTGRAKLNSKIYASDSALSKIKWQQIKRKLINKNIHLRYIDMPYAENYVTSSSLYECPAARWSCEINSNGVVAPCTMARIEIPQQFMRFENLIGSGILNIWNGPVFKKFREWQDSGCLGCRLQKECGKCIPQSFKWFNNPKYPPAFCVNKGEILGLSNLDSLRELLKTDARK